MKYRFKINLVNEVTCFQPTYLQVTCPQVACVGTDTHTEQSNKKSHTARDWGEEWPMWIWQLLYHRVWHVVAGENCAIVPMGLIHAVCYFIWPWCIPVWQPPVHGHQPQAQCLYFTLTLEKCVIQASSGCYVGDPATSLALIVFHPLHNFP